MRIPTLFERRTKALFMKDGSPAITKPGIVEWGLTSIPACRIGRICTHVPLDKLVLGLFLRSILSINY